MHEFMTTFTLRAQWPLTVMRRGLTLSRRHNKFHAIRSRMRMETLQDRAPKIITLLLVAVFLSGCAARKSRILERADSYFKKGENDKAKIEYLSLLRADPQNTTAFEKLGNIWFEEGAPLRAAPFLLRTRELAPNNLDNRAKLARVFASVGQNAEARKEAVTILQQSPAHDEGILILASTDRSKEDVAYTEQQLQKLPQRDDVSLQLASD